MDIMVYRIEWGKWLGSYVWDYFCTFTFKKNITTNGAKKCFYSFIRGLNKEVAFFLVIEGGLLGARMHIHALLGNMKNISRETIEKSWMKRYGRAEASPYDMDLGASYYVCKELGNKAADWDVTTNLDKMRTVKEVIDKVTALRKPYYENGALKGYRITL